MKIIIITTREPIPPFGGDKERIMSLVNCIPIGCEIFVYYLYPRQKDAYQLQLSNGNIIHFVAIKHTVKNIVFDNHIINWFKYPLQSIIYQNKTLKKTIQQHDFKGNIIVFHLFRAWQFVELRNVKIWIELTDLISRNYSSIRLLDYIRYPKNIIFRLDLKRIKALEKMLCFHSNILTLISRYEAGVFMRENTNKKIEYLPLIYTKKLLTPKQKKGNRVCVVGNFFSVQNQIILNEAISYFIIARLRIPSLSLKVVGKIPPSLKSKITKNHDIIFIEDVENLLDEISDCKFGLCPMIQGAGVQNKILDYLSANVIPLSTGNAVSEFGLVDREHYIDLNGEDWMDELARCTHDDSYFSRYIQVNSPIIEAYSLQRGEKNVGKLITTIQD